MIAPVMVGDSSSLIKMIMVITKMITIGPKLKLRDYHGYRNLLIMIWV